MEPGKKHRLRRIVEARVRHGQVQRRDALVGRLMQAEREEEATLRYGLPGIAASHRAIAAEVRAEIENLDALIASTSSLPPTPAEYSIVSETNTPSQVQAAWKRALSRQDAQAQEAKPATAAGFSQAEKSAMWRRAMQRAKSENKE